MRERLERVTKGLLGDWSLDTDVVFRPNSAWELAAIQLVHAQCWYTLYNAESCYASCMVQYAYTSPKVFAASVAVVKSRALESPTCALCDSISTEANSCRLRAWRL